MRKAGRIVFLIAGTFAAWTAQAQDVAWAPTAIDTSLHVRALFVAGDGTVFAGTDGGLLRSTDEGGTWDVVGPVGVNDLAVLPSGGLVAVGREGGHRSLDGGVTWTEVLPKPILDECGDKLQYNYVVPGPGGEVYAGSIEEDTGSSHCKINGYLYRSVDGVNWSDVPTSFFDSQAALFVSPDTLIYGGDQGGIALYLNIGTDQSITRKFTAELQASVTALVMDTQRRVYAATGRGISGGGEGTGIHRSADNGETWQAVSKDLTDLTVEDLVFHADGTLLAATLNGGVHRSSDGGDSWQVINAGLPSLHVTALAVTDEGFVFAGTDRGIYRSTEAIATAAEAAAERPARFVLHGNYPNPFNPQTTIRFDLPAASAVRLVVYDALGREVVRLLDAQLPAGRHEAVFAAAGLPSGLYVYRLTAGGQVRSGKMLLMK